ncbi:hypothetical protein [Telmatospirillum sp. J64-1]|uniref:hypothetical protein n=1 Tax=Telmatospirillum sp. J64-1 TaxID=2502183 RepID=UPI00115F3E04|nr:hypothetical protein [Telmatospirillum sp. J64-1]
MQQLTREQVKAIAGPMDDLRMAEVIGTGATPAELAEARRWVEGYKRTLGDADPLRPTVIDRLCDILRSEEPEWYDQ